jgi:acetyl esterase
VTGGVVAWRVSLVDHAVRAARAAIRTALKAPTPLLVALAGGRVQRDGLVLDPQVAATLVAVERLGISSIEHMTPAAARTHSQRAMAAFDAEPRPMDSVLDTAVAGPAGRIPVRIYRPRSPDRGLLIYFHGGGGVLGSVEAADPFARVLADETRCQVASVEYRLAPEAPHPAAIDDAEAAYRAIAKMAPDLHADPTRLVLVGDSMGGYLCAHVERRVATSGPRPALQVLIYPLADLTFSHPSFKTFGDGFVLTAPTIHWFADHYLPDVAARRAASPLFAEDLTGTVPTIIVTAGFDPLRDEGRELAERLRRAGSTVVYRCHGELIHGFVSMTGAVDAARIAVSRLAEDIRAALYPEEMRP